MNRDDIIRMAKNEFGIYAFTADDLAKFVELIASVEREACASFAEQMGNVIQIYNQYGSDVLVEYATIIRGRGAPGVGGIGKRKGELNESTNDS